MTRKIARCFMGDMRHLATIRVNSATTDGETKPTWSDHDTSVPCSRVYKGGKEVVIGDKVVAGANETIRMRFRDDLTPQMRLRFGTTGTDDVLEVVSLGDPIGDRMWLELRCTRIEST